MKSGKIYTILILLFITVTAVSAVFASDDADTLREKYNGKTIGVQVGTISGAQAEAYFDNINLEFFNSQTDLVTALKAGKIIAACTDEALVKIAMVEHPDIKCEPEYIDIIETAAIFPKNEKGEKIEKQYSEFVRKLWEDGTIAEIDSVWFGNNKDKKVVIDYTKLPDKNGTLRMAVDLSIVPFSFMQDDIIVGYDVDIAARFCKEYGYRLEIIPMAFEGIIPSILSGKTDFSACNITITKERAESVLFSEPTYRGDTVIVYLSGDAETKENKLVAADIDMFSDVPKGVYDSLSELNSKDRTIGIQTGTSFDEVVSNHFPLAKKAYFTNKADLTNSLLAGKIDAYVIDEPVVRTQMEESSELTFIPEYLDSYDFAYVFPKTERGENLRDRISDFLKELKSDGKLKELDEKWNSSDQSVKTMMDYRKLPDKNGKLVLATEALYEPFTYISDGNIVGYDIEIAALFCEKYGYAFEVTDMNFDAVLPSVQSGKYDFGAAGITVTEERAESVYFSEPNYTTGTVMVVQAEKEAATSENAFFSSIEASFEKTFIRENRWKLFLQGIFTTLLITVLSVIFGTCFGFLLFMMCRNGNPYANKITSVCLWVVQGMPMVVLLMVLYYVVFASVSINGIAVAVIGFTLTFGAAVYGLLRIGVGSIDNGQYEAAYALGYSDIKTFFKIIIPQALPLVMPAYSGEIVNLIKATAIVGYIAVQDLTRMGDIVRSRTYEAFFPLIAVTVIYFGLEAIFGACAGRIHRNIDKKKRRRKDILKGIETND